MIKTRSYRFALRIIELYKQIVAEKKEYTLAKQILRSGTSIGANIEEAIGAQSRRDFIARLSISYRESRETTYWLKLLIDTGFIASSNANDLIQECEQITKIIAKIIITTKQNSFRNS